MEMNVHEHRTPFPMTTFLRAFAFGAMLVPTLAAQAQPAPPYAVTISGTVQGCSPNSVVTVTNMASTQPEVNLQLPVGPNCAFDTLVYMDSAGGGFIFTTPCNGALITGVGQYQVNLLGTATVQVTLNCVSNTVDCLGILGGSALPGTPCSDPSGQSGTWSNSCDCVVNGSEDCLGIPGGPNVPGTPCTTAAGVSGIWSNSCVCQTNNTGCQAAFTLASIGPWAAQFTSSSSGTAPFTYFWQFPTENSPVANPIYTFPGAGTYTVCLTIADGGGCTSVTCDSVYVDTNGGISTDPPANYFDCLLIPNGPNLPGTPCTATTGGVLITGTWNAQCECVGSNTSDCLGIINGPNLPGTPCSDPATGTTGIWSNNCVCQPNNTPSCQAAFWVMQAYTLDSSNTGGAIPIPFELWIWNLSSGGTGAYQFLWNFGDGTSSTEAFPTHVYPGPGPYQLCLTIVDGAGCTSTSCDSIQVDQNGILGMSPGPELRSQLRINVIQSVPTAIEERPVIEGTRSWPNPVNDLFNLMINSSRSGVVELSIIDSQGRTVQQRSYALHSGMNNLELDVEALHSGIYLLRLQHGNASSVVRFVKE
jgi:PKD repeat protein